MINRWHDWWIKIWRGDSKNCQKLKEFLKNREVWGRGDTKIKEEKEEVTGKGDTKKNTYKTLAFAS